MSKSKGNVVTPMGLLQEHGSDGVRYWAASGRPGADTAFDTGQMRVGRRLAIKILNASKFVLSAAEPCGAITAPLDRGMLTQLGWVVRDTTLRLDEYDYTRALELTETWFWSFCDNYLELAKGRRYGDQGPELAGSANGALTLALSVVLRLFAPFLPFVTDEVWSWWHDGSVHRAAWPAISEIQTAIGEDDGQGCLALERAVLVLGAVRRKKSEEKRAARTPVHRALVRDTESHLDALRLVDSDIRAAGVIGLLQYERSGDFDVLIELADLQASTEQGA